MALKDIITIQNSLCVHWANVSNLIYWGIKPFQLIFYQLLRALETPLTTARVSELKHFSKVTSEPQATVQPKPQKTFDGGLARRGVTPRRQDSPLNCSNPAKIVFRNDELFSSRLKVSDVLIDSALMISWINTRQVLGINLFLNGDHTTAVWPASINLILASVSMTPDPSTWSESCDKLQTSNFTTNRSSL